MYQKLQSHVKGTLTIHKEEHFIQLWFLEKDNHFAYVSFNLKNDTMATFQYGSQILYAFKN